MKPVVLVPLARSIQGCSLKNFAVVCQVQNKTTGPRNCLLLGQIECSCSECHLADSASSDISLNDLHLQDAPVFGSAVSVVVRTDNPDTIRVKFLFDRVAFGLDFFFPSTYSPEYYRSTSATCCQNAVWRIQYILANKEEVFWVRFSAVGMFTVSSRLAHGHLTASSLSDRGHLTNLLTYLPS